ncbi:MAG: hypothetical protein ACSHWZ_15605 [Sulfitobacter sp.]
MTERPVIGSMATFPARFEILRSTIGSIAPQLDKLYVYVNDTTDGFPDFSDMPNVEIMDGRDHAGDLSARGKVYPLQFISNSRVFTFDDDFIYPPDYVARNLEMLDRFDGKCVVTTHGSILPSRAQWYYERSKVFMSTREVQSPELCTLAGSGTFCFDQNTLPLDLDDLLGITMVDIKVSLAARAAGLPIWVLPRPEGWLINIKMPGLWEQFTDAQLTPHTHLARQIDWSFSHYARIARDAMQEVGLLGSDLGLSLELARAIETDEPPVYWKTSRISFTTRERYFKLLNEMEGN